MTKPNEFRKTYMIRDDVSYRNTGSTQKGTHAGEGMLQRGRVVWLENDPQQASEAEQVAAYAEGVGVVLLTPSSVQPIA